MPLHLNENLDIATRATASNSSAAWRLSRRSFLAVCAALCCRAPNETQRPREQTWAFVSDTHICSDQKLVTRGTCMADNLRCVVDAIGSAQPDHVLFNGDIAYWRGRPADYAAFNELIAPLRNAAMPMHLMLGNHDHRQHFAQAFHVAGDADLSGKTVSSRMIGGVHWLMLDSLERVSAIRGSLGAAQRQWLASRLDAEPQSPAIVCVHHNPERWRLGLTDATEFLGIVVPRRQVKLVLFGHMHEYRMWQTEGLHFVNLPAVGYRFKPNAALGWVRARLRPDGMSVAFQGVSSRAPEHGNQQELCWRASA